MGTTNPTNKEYEQRLERLEKQMKKMEQNGKSTKGVSSDKKPRKPSEFNNFMSECLKKKKDAAGDTYNHKKAFKECTEEWNAKKAKDVKEKDSKPAE